MIAYGCQNFVVVFDPKSVQVRAPTEMFWETLYQTTCLKLSRLGGKGMDSARKDIFLILEQMS